MVFVLAAALLNGLLACDGGLPTIEVEAAPFVERETLADVDLSGLDGFKGDIGRARYEEF